MSQWVGQTSEGLATEHGAQTTWMRVTWGSERTAYSPDLPAGIENLWSTDAWVPSLPAEPESLVTVPRHGQFLKTILGF